NGNYSTDSGSSGSREWTSDASVDDDPWADNNPTEQPRNRPSGNTRQGYSGNSSSQPSSSQRYDDEWGDQDEAW
ncbi:MAG: hypothetical protein AAF959_02215, partial [Cyanobacteria bacterium P01_D01_bin.56]